MEEKLDKLFHLKERGTTVRTEVLAGLTTFVTAAYVLAVNPSVMSATGMDSGAVFTATALVCFLGTLVMALLTNYPFVLVPSMGLNAYFAYTEDQPHDVCAGRCVHLEVRAHLACVGGPRRSPARHHL